MQGKGSAAVEPGNMLWLIQRDFLEGKTVQAMVKEALAPVTNPHGDHDISQVHLCRAPPPPPPPACQPRACDPCDCHAADPSAWP